jgi:hypothetical protein
VDAGTPDKGCPAVPAERHGPPRRKRRATGSGHKTQSAPRTGTPNRPATRRSDPGNATQTGRAPRSGAVGPACVGNEGWGLPGDLPPCWAEYSQIHCALVRRNRRIPPHIQQVKERPARCRAGDGVMTKSGKRWQLRGAGWDVTRTGMSGWPACRGTDVSTTMSRRETSDESACLRRCPGVGHACPSRVDGVAR